MPSKLQELFLSWKKGRLMIKAASPSCVKGSSHLKTVDSVSFPPVFGSKGRLRATGKTHGKVQVRSHLNGRFSQVDSLSQVLLNSSASTNSKRSPREPSTRTCGWLHKAPEAHSDSILSFHTPVHYLETYGETKFGEPLCLPV